MSVNPTSEFERASLSRDHGFLSDLLAFLRNTRKWWLLPILTVLLLFGILLVLSGTAAAPLIYTLF
jgi:hypothetical protein